jgi:hypothetical protein
VGGRSVLLVVPARSDGLQLEAASAVGAHGPLVITALDLIGTPPLGPYLPAASVCHTLTDAPEAGRQSGSRTTAAITSRSPAACERGRPWLGPGLSTDAALIRCGAGDGQPVALLASPLDAVCALVDGVPAAGDSAFPLHAVKANAAPRATRVPRPTMVRSPPPIIAAPSYGPTPLRPIRLGGSVESACGGGRRAHAERSQPEELAAYGLTSVMTRVLPCWQCESRPLSTYPVIWTGSPVARTECHSALSVTSS